jgi:hypothetical protein
VRQLTWAETATNKLLFEAGFGAYQAPFGPYESPGNPNRDLVRMTEQCTAGCPTNGNIPNLVYRSGNWSDSWDAQYTWRGSAAYVTGAHNLKVGYGGVALVSDPAELHEQQEPGVHGQQRDRGVADAVIAAVHHELPHAEHVALRAGPVDARRMTVQGALRFDRNSSFSPEETIPASAFLAAPLVFPETKGVDAYKDISPRGAWPTTCSATGRPRSR